MTAQTTIAPLLDDQPFNATEFATQRFAFIASSGGGKSYACGRVVEDLARANVPVVVVDTVGIWPAIRLAADGRSPGLPFVVIGGEHADVPFVPARAGELARFILRQNASAVVDVSDLMPDERAAPMAEFFETALLEIKASRRPRFFVLDEGQDLVPEHAGKGEARLVRAVSGFVRKSRNHLCGTAILTQRPQDVSKTVLNQVGNLFVGMLFGDHERKAIARWVSSKANSAAAHEQIKHLAELQPGDFFFWSPSWQKLFGKFRFAAKWTFDGSSTTPIGPDAELGKVAPVDVAALRDLLAPAPPPSPAKRERLDRVARLLAPAPDAQPVASNGSSPEHAALVAENEQLRRQLEACQGERDHAFDVSSALNDQLDDLRCELTRTLEEAQGRVVATSRVLRAAADELEVTAGYLEAGRAVMGTASPADRQKPMVRLPGAPPASTAVVPSRNARSKDGSESSASASPRENARSNRAAAAVAQPGTATVDAGGLDAYAETLVAAIKAYGPLTRRQLALVTGVSLVSSTFSTTLGKLHAEGWVETVAGKLVASDRVVFVGEPLVPGVECLCVPAPRLERGRAVREYWLRERLDAYRAKLLQTVLAQRGGLTRAELAKAAAVSGVSSTFSTTLGQMRRAGIFTYTGGKVALSAEARWAMLG